MKRLYPFIVLLCSLSSCVTLFNGPYTDLKVNVPYGTRVIYKNEQGVMDTLMPDIRNNVRLIAKRSGTVRLPVTISNDTFERTIFIRPTHSSWYYANIYPSCGLGFLADGNNPDRFSYPYKIYPALHQDAGPGYRTSRPYKPRTFEWAIYPPLINVFTFATNDIDPSGTLLGIATGINYHYSKGGFIATEIGTAVYGSGVLIGERFQRDTVGLPLQRTSAWYVNVRDHHAIGRFDVGYGFSAGEHSGKKIYNTYQYATYAKDSVPYSRRVANFGGSFCLNYRITSSFYAGINYQPQALMVDKGIASFNYEHMFNLNLYWRIDISSKK